MKVLVIPDCHLKPWMFAQADTIMKKGIADKAVCLMDLADDFGVHDDAQYLETYETAIAFAKEHPDTLWCYGNHDLSYIWGKPETGYHPEKRGLVCQEIKKLTNTLPKKSQLAYIHKIDKTLFMHGGLANLFVQLRVAPQNRKNVLAAVKAINQMGCETMWAADSPIWYRPQLSPNQNAKRLYRGGEYLQVVGHTPVKEVYLEGGVLSCDTFSTYRDGTPYGSQAFCIVDTITLEFETVKGGFCYMNNKCDDDWFGRENVFNTLSGKHWEPTKEPVNFEKERDWQRYVDSRRLEITCGEAPYLVSRYDAATGEELPIESRIGILDRKLRVVNENTDNETDWLKWTRRAFESTYGYEYQGDNLLVARINLLMTFMDYMQERWRREPTAKELNRIANVICWNIWQMDGLKGTIPGKELYISDDYEQLSLFASDFEQETLFDEAAKQNKKYECKIRDWRAMRTITYNKMKGEK